MILVLWLEEENPYLTDSKLLLRQVNSYTGSTTQRCMLLTYYNSHSFCTVSLEPGFVVVADVVVVVAAVVVWNSGTVFVL